MATSVTWTRPLFFAAAGTGPDQLLSRVPEMNPAWLIRYSRVAWNHWSWRWPPCEVQEMEINIWIYTMKNPGLCDFGFSKAPWVWNKLASILLILRMILQHMVKKGIYPGSNQLRHALIQQSSWDNEAGEVGWINKIAHWYDMVPCFENPSIQTERSTLCI